MPNPAVPTALKLLRGNPGKRSINKKEPQPEVKEPHCPEHLDEAAKVEWARMAPILVSMRVLTEADYMALANLCQAYSTMAKAQAQLNIAGILHKTPNGHIQPSPLISIVNQNADLVIKLCREFGLTPSSRSKVTTGPQEKTTDNPWDDL